MTQSTGAQQDSRANAYSKFRSSSEPRAAKLAQRVRGEIEFRHVISAIQASCRRSVTLHFIYRPGGQSRSFTTGTENPDQSSRAFMRPTAERFSDESRFVISVSLCYGDRSGWPGKLFCYAPSARTCNREAKVTDEELLEAAAQTRVFFIDRLPTD